MVETPVTCWVVDHPAHAQALLPFIREGSTSDLIVATKRPDVEHLIAESEGIMPRRETTWVERPVGLGIGSFAKMIRANNRIKQIKKIFRSRMTTQRSVTQVVAIASPLELIAAKSVGIERRLYISDNECDHISHRLALRSASEILLPESWRMDLDGGFMSKANKKGIPVQKFPGNKAHVYLRPATIVDELSDGKRIMVRRLVGGGIHDSEMVKLDDITLECILEEHTEGDALEQPWSLPNRTLDYDGVITQSVSLATESASLGVPTLLVSNAKRGIMDELVEMGVLTIIDNGEEQNSRIEKWADELDTYSIDTWPDAVKIWREIIQK